MVTRLYIASFLILLLSQKSIAFISQVSKYKNQYSRPYLSNSSTTATTRQNDELQTSNEPLTNNKIEPTSSCHRKEEEEENNEQLIVRNININDIITGELLNMCMKEYLNYGSTSNDIKNKIIDYIELCYFSIIIQFGLFQRIFINGHDVLCLENIEYKNNKKILGMAEVSLQPFNPECTASSFALPLIIKTLLVAISSNEKKKTLAPYLSNVIIHPNYRNKGYGTMLIHAAESFTTSKEKLGYGGYLYLHVEAFGDSSNAARSLYKKLDYVPFTNANTENNNFVDNDKIPQFIKLRQEEQCDSLHYIQGLYMFCLRKEVI